MTFRGRLMATVAVAAIGLTLSACSKEPEAPAGGNGAGGTNTMNDMQRDMGNAMNEAGNLLNQQKDQFIAMLSSQADSFNGQMTKLKARAEELEGDARQRIDQTIASLEERTAAFRQQFDELKNATGDAWEDMQAGLKKAGDELKQAYQDAIDEFDA